MPESAARIDDAAADRPGRVDRPGRSDKFHIEPGEGSDARAARGLSTLNSRSGCVDRPPPRSPSRFCFHRHAGLRVAALSFFLRDAAAACGAACPPMGGTHIRRRGAHPRADGVHLVVAAPIRHVPVVLPGMRPVCRAPRTRHVRVTRSHGPAVAWWRSAVTIFHARVRQSNHRQEVTTWQ